MTTNNPRPIADRSGAGRGLIGRNAAHAREAVEVAAGRVSASLVRTVCGLRTVDLACIAHRCRSAARGDAWTDGLVIRTALGLVAA